VQRIRTEHRGNLGVRATLSLQPDLLINPVCLLLSVKVDIVPLNVLEDKDNVTQERSLRNFNSP